MTREEMGQRGWPELDVLLVTGDAYVDHPSFGAALLGRWLSAKGYRVGIVAQPGWDDPSDVARLGRPRLFAGVTAGAVDSMLAHYTAFRKKRSDDAYTPGGRAGARPNRATIVYTNLVRQAFPGKVFQTTIPRNIRLAEAPSHGKPVAFYDLKSKGAQAYLSLAREWLGLEIPAAQKELA